MAGEIQVLHFLSEYGLFLAKTITWVLAIIIVFAVIIGIASKGKAPKEKLKIKKLNKRYEDYKKSLSEEILTKAQLKKINKEEKAKLKNLKKQESTRKRIFVLNFDGDIKASATSSLREEITAILTIANSEDEVFLKLESPGGIVPSYGLAASQLKRLKDNKIYLTVGVDKVAASGGYLMACVADKILAAPYAIIGSIGVVAQLPNFHRLLKKKDIDFEQITAGEYKRTLSLFGEITEKGREKVQEDVDNIHEIFKSAVALQRPQADMNKVATGEHWHGMQALELKLVDDLMTSDDYLMKQSEAKDIYELHFTQKKTLLDKFSLSAKAMIASLMGNKIVF